jgi:ATP-dependent DNA helicase PIF1
MRVQLYGDAAAGLFASKLLDVGNGAVLEGKEEQLMFEDFARVPTQELLINNVYPQVTSNFRDRNWLCERAVLAPQNITARAINQQLMRQLPGEEQSYKSLDTVVEPEEATQYPTEFLNSLEPTDLPPHTRTLKTGYPVMLLRNIDPPKLCNGTRLFIKQMNNNAIEGTILTGQAKDNKFFFQGSPLYLQTVQSVSNGCSFPFASALQ